MRVANVAVVLGLLSASGIRAQYTPDTARVSCISDVFVLLGAQAESGGVSPLAEARDMAPGSLLLQGDLSDHTFHERIPAQAGFAFHSSLTLPLGKDHPNGVSTRLRAGIGFGQFFSGEAHLSREVRTAYDTLVSSGTGTETYVDSVTRSDYRIQHEHQRLGLDVAVLFVRDFPGHWSLYGGVGALLGTTMAGRTTIDHDVEHYLDPVGAEEQGNNNSRTRTHEEEAVRTPSAFFATAEIPFGIGFRISRRNPFWRTMVITNEIRPSLTFGGETFQAEQVRTSFSYFFGLRVDLNRAAQ